MIMSTLAAKILPVDALLVTVGAVYFVASLLLFVMGANLCALSLTVWRQRKPGSAGHGQTAAEVDRSTLPPVTVQLPIFNELYVAERVMTAAAELDYPRDRLQIQVLDDSTDETSDLIAAVAEDLASTGVDIVHHRRADRQGYKAGALADGFESAAGELIAIFDADFVPPSDFLLRTVSDFDDPSVAFVQGRWGHINRDHSAITRLQSLAIDAHFSVEQTARGLLGFWFNFNGTAGIWRKAAITDAGGWTADTLTEDLDLSYRAHLRGWRGRYRDDVEVPGELPAQMSSFRRQQHRWARGSLECAIKLLPSTWRSAAPLTTKLEATAHLTAYTIHLLLFTVALLYPLMIVAGLRFDGLDVLYGFGYLFGLTSVAPALFFITGQRQVRGSWVRELPRIIAVSVLGSGLMLNTVRAATQILTTPNPEFERTAKFGLGSQVKTNGTDGWRHKRYLLGLDRIVYGEVVFGAYCALSAALAWQQRNWAIFAWATIFAVGLLSLAAITAGQATDIRARRSDRQPTDRPAEALSVSTEPRTALVIMAKEPIVGSSKTRLTPALGEDEAAELSRCFVLDTIDLAVRFAAGHPEVDVIVAGTPAGASEWFAANAPGVGYVEQRGDRLGDRLHGVLSGALADGYDLVLAINSDSPTLPVSVLADGLRRLQTAEVDVVLGPADDGGYYLIGCKQPHPRIVRDVEMSTPTVLADTVAIASQEGLVVALLDRWYDVDEPADLCRVRADLEREWACGDRTAAFFERLPELGRATSGREG